MREGLALDWHLRAECRPVSQLMAFVASHFRRLVTVWTLFGPMSRLSQIAFLGREPRVQLDVAGRSENFLVDMEATYSVLISYSRAFSSQ